MYLLRNAHLHDTVLLLCSSGRILEVSNVRLQRQLLLMSAQFSKASHVLHLSLPDTLTFVGLLLNHLSYAIMLFPLAACLLLTNPKMFTLCAVSAWVLYNIMVQSFFGDNSGPKDTALYFGMVNIMSPCSTGFIFCKG